MKVYSLIRSIRIKAYDMCAWKRGVQNNLPGQIRLGHIKEFQQNISNRDGDEASQEKEVVRTTLKVLRYEHFINGQYKNKDIHHLTEVDNAISLDHGSSEASVSSNQNALSINFPAALICLPSKGLSKELSDYMTSHSLASPQDSSFSQEPQYVYLHSHKFPHSILPCVIHDLVPTGCILMKDYQLVNCKVCVGDLVEFTLYLGEMLSYDTREGAIRDTTIRYRSILPITRVLISIQSINKNGSIDEPDPIDGKQLSREFNQSFRGCIITTEEVYSITFSDRHLICRVSEIITEQDDDNDIDEENDISLPDSYRGIIDGSTEFFIESKNPSIQVHNAPVFQLFNNLKNIVYILTSDHEVFPTKRRLLRPCLSLTFLVQSGRGIYADSQHSRKDHERNSTVSIVSNEEKIKLFNQIDEEYLDKELIKVSVDACTFDRVLLYLEHEARGDSFRFDPLLVNDIYDAANSLNILGLKEICQRVVGSFQERVRKTPIRLEEIITRNRDGGYAMDKDKRMKRKETILLMSNMVFDITHWLDEHPGGSMIIPEQALNVDSTIFFEIYHASRQSFLYLKEFYIGELAVEDCDKVQLPTNCPLGTKASDAFIEQLKKVTDPWRLKQSDLKEYIQVHKSF